MPLASLEDWLEFAEAVLGRQDLDGLVPPFENLSDLKGHEDGLLSEAAMDMDSFMRLEERFPWLKIVQEIAEEQGFFHWELRFASIFEENGFDLQMGNPPWVRPTWQENPVLAEADPWFELQAKPPALLLKERKVELLSKKKLRSFYLSELTYQVGVESFIGSVVTYDLLSGTQPDLYRAMMVRTWRNTGALGVVGLLHPDSHFVGDAERFLRAEAYRRLRVHGDFANKGNRFFPEPVSRNVNFGLHIYASPGEIEFLHASWLMDASELPKSITFAEFGVLPEKWGKNSGVPGIKYLGDWDSRPHPARVIHVDSGMLSEWRLLLGGADRPIEHTRLLNPVTVQEQGAIAALGKFEYRFEERPRISSGYHESNARREGIIRGELCTPDSWDDLILKGAQIGVAAPFFKQPTGIDSYWPLIDLTALPNNAVPRSEYVRATDLDTYRDAQDAWVHEHGSTGRYTDFYRVMWREMIPQANERSLFAAIYPPGPAHIHGVRSLAMPCNRETVLAAGFLSALAMDYLLRVTKTEHFDVKNVRAIPAPTDDHPLADALLVRTLRLNCLTSAYAALWEELFTDTWRDETWAVNWPNSEPLGHVNPTWERTTPLRAEYERRAALVEIDALVAVWLGVTEEQLEAIYPTRYPVLGDYEEFTWFDANGRKIASNWNTFGVGQTKKHWEQFQLYLDHPKTNAVPNGYAAPFYKANRIAEYRQAHAAFTERMKAGGS